MFDNQLYLFLINLNHYLRFMRKAVILSFLFVAIISCSRDKIDFDMIDDLTVSPGLQVPVARATLTLNDLVVEDSNLTVDPDNALRIIFREDSLFSFSATDFVDIPVQDPVGVPLVSGGPPVDLDIDLGTLGGVELTQAIFDEGYFKYDISSDSVYSFDVGIRIAFVNATLNSVTFDTVVTLPSGTVFYADSIDISGLDFDFSNGGTTFNYIGVRIELDNPGSVPPGKIFSFNIQFSGIQIEQANGFFGQRNINIPSGQFDFNIAGLENFTDGFFLANPTINLIAASSIGAGLQLDLDLDGVNADGDISSLNADPIVINRATTINQFDTSIIAINNTNSQIVDFLASLPQQILYSGEALLNPSTTTPTNFITKDSKVVMGVELDLPLEISASDMKIEETIDDFRLAQDDNADFVESLTLFFKTFSTFPFDVDVNVAFLDSLSGDSIEGVNIPLLTPAPVDGNGRVTQRVTSDFNIAFEQSQIDGLMRANKLRISARVNTANNGQQVVKLYTDYELELRLAAKTKINYNLSND